MSFRGNPYGPIPWCLVVRENLYGLMAPKVDPKFALETGIGPWMVLPRAMIGPSAPTDRSRRSLLAIHIYFDRKKSFGVRSPVNHDRRFLVFWSLTDRPWELHLNFTIARSSSNTIAIVIATSIVRSGALSERAESGTLGYNHWLGKHRSWPIGISDGNLREKVWNLAQSWRGFFSSLPCDPRKTRRSSANPSQEMHTTFGKFSQAYWAAASSHLFSTIVTKFTWSENLFSELSTFSITEADATIKNLVKNYSSHVPLWKLQSHVSMNAKNYANQLQHNTKSKATE